MLSEDLERHYADRWQRTTCRVPNGVAPDTVEDRSILERAGLRDGGFVLFVGRIVPEKHPDLLAHVYRDIPGDLPLVVAGGDSYSGETSAALHRAAKGDTRVRLLGAVAPAQVQALYRAAALLVLPSSLEGQPMVLLEAGVHGTPVVASDIPPHVELLDGPTPRGFLFRTGDGDALRAAIVSALADPVERSRRGAAFADHVTARFRWDSVASTTEGVYRRALERRAGSSNGTR